MSSFEECNNNNDKDISSPILFTQSQKSSRKRKFSSDAVQSGRNSIQSTPVVDNLLENAGLEEHSFSTTERINYDSPLNSVLNITKSGSFGTNRSSQEKSHWFFDTPSEKNESLFTRKHRVVSRRSLDKLIDPEVSIGWLESMATPPSDTSDRTVQMLTVPDQKESNVSPALGVVDAARDEPEIEAQTKRSVARVLFNQDKMLTVAKQKNDGDNSCLFAKEDGIKVLEDQSYCNSRADLINLSSVASDNDEIHNLSPCVVEHKVEKLGENDEGCTIGIFNWKDAIQISDGNDCVEATKEAFREKSYLGPASVTLNRQLLSLEWINEESTENEPISSSPPVVCSGVKKKTFKNTEIGSSDNKDRTKLLDCSGTIREEDDLKRKNRRKRRKEKRGRVGGSNEKPMTSHSEQTNAKGESNRTFDIELKSDDCVCVSPGIASSLEYKEKGKINKGIDTTTSSPSPKGCCSASTQYGATSACARENNIPNRDTRNFIGGDSICSPVNTGVGKSHLELACENEKCVQQKRTSNVGDRGKTQSVDSHEESQAELYFSPFKVGTDKQDFSFSPRKESDISETFDLDPPSPTVVSAWKQDVGKSSKFSKNNGDDVFGSTPRHRSPVLYDRLPKPLYESDLPHSSAMEKQFTAISPIVSYILPCLDGAIDCVLNSTTENLNSIDDLQGIPMCKAVCPDTDGVHLGKKKGSDGKLEKNSESEWVIGSIIEETLERMFSKLEQSWLGESDAKVEQETGPLREALSPADVIPKTPAKQKASEASRLKRRIDISGANLRRRSSTRKCILTQSVVDLPPGLDSSIATNHTEQLIKSISDHRSVESESGNDDDKHRLGFIECTEQQQECHGLLVYSELPDDGLEQDSVNVPLSLVLRHSTHKDFRDCLRELPEAQEKSSKSKDEEFGLEYSTLTCRKRPVSGISNVEVGTNVPQRFGEQHSIDEVVGSESLLVDTLICHEDPANLSGIPDKDSHTLTENEDLDKSGISSRKGSTNLVYRVANNVIREDAQVLQAVDDNILCDHSSLFSSENDAEIKDDDVTFTSMEILDDLMFDRKALESDLSTNSFKDGPDSLADFSSPSETPEKVFPRKFVGKAIDSCHIKQKDDCLKEERNLLDQIAIAKPCQIKRCEKVLQIPFGNAVECRSKAEESPPSEGVVTNRLELRCPNADKSVMGNGEKSVSDRKMADSEKHDRKSRGNQIMSHLFNDRSCGSEANLFLKSNAKGERNDADLHASLQEFARGDGFIDVTNDEAIINITMSDTLLSPIKDVSEATNDNSDNVVCARKSHSCIGEKSDCSNLSFCDKASLAIKKACASACYDTEPGLSQLLNSNFDFHELTQMYEARCEPGQSETLICKGVISKHDGSVLHENRIDSSLEFGIASGRTVDVSEKMQDADKKELEENDGNSKGIERNGGFSGFSTASGRKVDISEKALDAARKKLEEDDGNSKDIERNGGFSGFSTASGRKVDISEKALDAARKKLEENDGNSKDIERNGGFSGFSTASGRKVDISEKALDAARKKLEEDDGNSKDRERIGGFSGFSTASGRKVDISEKALDAARKKLEEDDGNSKDRSGIGGFSGFSTASGRKVDISEKALDAARKKLEENDGNSKDRERIGGFSGFSTASGRKVDISEKALDAARKKLEEKEGNSKDKDKTEGFSGFSTAYRKKANVSVEVLDARKNVKSGVENMDEIGKGVYLLDVKIASNENNGGAHVREADKDILPLSHRPVGSCNISRQRCADVLYNEVSEGLGDPSNDMFNDSLNGIDLPFVELSERVSEDRKTDAEMKSQIQREDAGPGLKEQHQRKDRSGGPQCIAEPIDYVMHESVDQGPINLPMTKKILEMGRQSAFTFKGKSSHPSEYHSDRDAKHTIPLIPRLARVQDHNSLDMLRRGLPKPMSLPRRPSTASNSTPSNDCSTSDMRSTAAKAFSTPYKLKKNNPDAEHWTAARRQLKRPLLACVPFGKKLKIESEKKQQFEAGRVKPQPGRLYQLKNIKQRPSLSQLTNDQQPCCYTKDELEDCGLHQTVINVSSENAKDFLFRRESFSDYALRKGVTIIGDGAKLALNKEGCAGLTEFLNAFVSLAGVDKTLINDVWFANQYRWVVWKLASLERSFPYLFAGRCLTPNEVMYHLKYRYDKEIDRAERSAVKKILERDDISTNKLVLCVSRIFSSEQTPERSEIISKGIELDENHSKVVIEVTDGWYPLKAILDRPLSSFIQVGKLKVGQKLCICGANLIGSEQAVPPLEAPDSLMLELSANSTRRAHWDAKLGFQSDRRAFPVPIHSLFPDGGIVGCVDVVIQRIYPPQWMEKSSGGYVFRNALQEQRASKKYSDEKHSKMERIYEKIRQDYENSCSSRDRRRSRRKSNKSSMAEISEIMTGHELYEIFESAYDPGSLQLKSGQACLLVEVPRTGQIFDSSMRQLMINDHQRDILAKFRSEKEEEHRATLQKKFDEAWKDVVKSFPERVVLPLQKFKVANFKLFTKKAAAAAETYLTVWNPTEDMNVSWKEGQRVKIYNLKASAARYKHVLSTVQLATMKSTRYELKKADTDALLNVFQPREVTSFSALGQFVSQIPKEVDVVGFVLFVDDHGSHSELQTVYLDDASDIFLAVKVWGGLKAYHLKEIIKPRATVCFKNLLLKRDCFSPPLATATFNDLSMACSNPKELYFTEAVRKLQNQIEDLPRYLNDRAEALRSKLRSGSRGTETSTPQKSCQSSAAFGTSCSSNASLFPHSNSTSSVVRASVKQWDAALEKEQQAISPSIGTRAIGDGMVSISLESSDEKELDQKRRTQKFLNEKKRQALVKYGEASSLSPMAAVITPKTRRGFIPPSRRKET